MEIWKDVKGYEGIYQVSNQGRVKALADATRRTHRAEHILSQGYHRGYRNVSLCKNGKMKTYQVHRLVATAFIDNPNNKPCVDHINTVKNDNRADNLRWVTPKENDANELSRIHKSISKRGHKNPNFKKDMSARIKSLAELNRTKVICIKPNGERLIYNSLVEAQNATGVCESNIGRVCRGERKTAGGFKWEYAPFVEMWITSA